MDTILPKLDLGLENGKELEERLGLMLYDDVDEMYQSKLYLLGTRWTQDYVSNMDTDNYMQFDLIQH